MTRWSAIPPRRVAAFAGGVVVACVAAHAAGADDPPPVTVRADIDGTFVLADGAPEAFPGPGVAALVRRHGRFGPGGDAPSVYVRGADGSWERRGLRVERSEGSLAYALRRAVEADARDASAGDTPSRFDLAVGSEDDDVERASMLAFRREFAARLAVLATGGASKLPLPAPGADLAEWAPPGMLFVRFRSPEAAFRMAGIADRIAQRLLAAQGDGTDTGTLRWALHDLVLPAMWNANPGGEKGVAETALVVGDWTGGRPQIAVLFRIRDAELHAMDTTAGVAFANRPEHRWKPQDDPEPASREPRNFRRVIGDVEIVATSEEMFRRVTEPTRPTIVHDAVWKSARGAGPAASEAMFVFADPEARGRLFGAKAFQRDGALRGMRWSLGAGELLRRWTGRAWQELAIQAAPRSAGALASLVSVVVTTDAKGARVSVSFANEDAAEEARAALEVLTRPFDDTAGACRSNRREIRPLARVERDAKDLAERCFVVFGWRPVCPCDGRYSAHPVTSEVSCSEHGSDAAPAKSPRPARPLARDLVRDGADVRMLVPVDWSRQ